MLRTHQTFSKEKYQAHDPGINPFTHLTHPYLRAWGEGKGNWNLAWVVVGNLNVHTHTHTNARTHTQTHTHTHKRTHAHTHTHTQKQKKKTKKPFCNKKLSLVFSSWSYGKTFSGPAHVTAVTTVFHGIAHAGPYSHMIKVPQPPSQPSKDVGRFHVATFRPQVAIPGQQGRLNNPRTFFKEKGT